MQNKRPSIPHPHLGIHHRYHFQKGWCDFCDIWSAVNLQDPVKELISSSVPTSERASQYACRTAERHVMISPRTSTGLLDLSKAI